jgi:type I restriction enzyme M protein
MMEKYKQELASLGFKEILDKSDNTLFVKGGDVSVYVVKVADKELKPELVNTWVFKVMELDPMPIYIWITNGDSNVYQEVESMRALPEIPASVTRKQVETFGKKKLSDRDKWSFEQYEKLQRKFNELHEQIYSARDAVNNSNDAIDEFCKLIFMEEFQLNHKNYVLQKGKLAGIKLSDLFSYSTIEKAKDKAKAVDDIRESFKEIKDHEDYISHLDDGTSAPIFDKDEYLKLQKPELYVNVLKALQDLGEITSDGVTYKATLLDLSGDVLGRVFDVLLRGKFENKGGMGIYLTPRQITEAAVDLVMHDLRKTPDKIVKVGTDGMPEFKMIDGCCGSGGFIIKMLHEIKRYMLHELSGDSKEYQKRFELMKEHSFVGADNSPGMILKARINMALHGAPKAPIFKTDNSLTSASLKPETFDVVLTNPPFKGGGVVDEPGEGRETLKAFRSDIDENGNWLKTSSGLALGAKPDSKGKWKPIGSVDPAVLFIDRYLQLLKPGGLCLMVVPDGILSNSGDCYVREYLMGKKSLNGEFVGGKAILKAVISLPTETFSLSGAGAKTSLLYFKKKESPTDKQGSVYMAVADKVGFTVKNQIEIQLGDDQNDLLKIIDAYKKG